MVGAAEGLCKSLKIEPKISGAYESSARYEQTIEQSIFDKVLALVRRAEGDEETPLQKHVTEWTAGQRTKLVVGVAEAPSRRKEGKYWCWEFKHSSAEKPIVILINKKDRQGIDDKSLFPQYFLGSLRRIEADGTYQFTPLAWYDVIQLNPY